MITFLRVTFVALVVSCCITAKAHADFTVVGTVVSKTGTGASVKITPLPNSQVEVFDRNNKRIGLGFSNSNGEIKLPCKTSLPKDANTRMVITPPPHVSQSNRLCKGGHSIHWF